MPPTEALLAAAETALHNVLDAADSKPTTLTGLWGSARALLPTVLTGSRHRTCLVLTATPARAEQLVQDCGLFSTLCHLTHPITLFPDWDLLPYQAATPPPELVRDRIAALWQLLSGEPMVLVTSVQACSQRLCTPEALKKAAMVVGKGETVERDALIDRLLGIGYRRAPLVERFGEVSARGHILDIFSPAYHFPIRLELFGDVVESVRAFDPATQRSTRDLTEAVLLPAREGWTANLDRLEGVLRRHLADTAIAPRALERQLQELRAGSFPGAEWLAPAGSERTATLWDYAPGATVILDEPDEVAQQATAWWGKAEHAYQEALRKGRLFPAPPSLFLAPDTLLRRLSRRPLIRLVALSADRPGLSPPLPCRSPMSLGIGVKGTTLSGTLSAIKTLSQTSRILLLARTESQQQRILEMLLEHDLPASLAPSAPIRVLVGALSTGCVLSTLKLALITEEEIFGKTSRIRPATPSQTFFSLSAGTEELRSGDLVVHLQHGIGRYRGLQRLQREGGASECVVIEYTGGDRLYVPLDHLTRLQRYVGVEGRQPKLDQLGGLTWIQTTRRVTRAVETIAKELLELYAAREVAHGHAFSPCTALQREFEAGFEYEETEDQLRAIEEVTDDMEQQRPMDRLVCGDVGYGKTEVALRAAMKAVQDSKQVALLVPTTLLAQQHYENFSRRFAAFPVTVEVLSRFRSRQEQQAILRSLADGRIDIIIGTHQLLRRDVAFRDLGLVILDEEQRFGVAQKEHLKRLRTSVDVLTLTATPIPRTLQMGLVGIRDPSFIHTPPAGRLAIRTFLVPFEDEIIQEAIRRELDRGGQVFVVHNRIETIDRMGRHLLRFIPDGQLAIAHGRMREKELEAVMRRFLARDCSVLLTTAIIASGLDIPTANTILIDRPDLFGLADLYQLRGRVGRSGEQAYAYLLVHGQDGLTATAKERLRAIQEFTELGSGFRLAARDLELRGAGTLLGHRQSGHAASVGYELYLQMIARAVREHRGEAVQEPVEPSLTLPVTALIPESWIPDVSQRLAAYRRLASVEGEQPLTTLTEELADRYGPLPQEAQRLTEVMALKLLARRLRIEKLEARGTGVTITFSREEELPRHVADPHVQRYPPQTLVLNTDHTWDTLYPHLTQFLTGLLP